MKVLLQKVEQSPALIRVVPFVLFLALTYLQGHLGEAARYWLYLVKTLVGAWMIAWMWPRVKEMRWNWSGAALFVGVGIFILWVGLDAALKALGLDPAFAKMGKPGPAWNPHVAFGADSALAWGLVMVRTLGSSLVVPPLEEVFYRSFVYRYLMKADFEQVPLSRFAWIPFGITSVLFGFEHYEWLAGLLCGLAFQGLVCGQGRLGDAITAHMITNFLLSVWVIWQNAWHFW